MRLDLARDRQTKPTMEEAVPESFHEAFELGARLGRGAFAQVRMARRVTCTDRHYAVKILDLQHSKLGKSSEELVEVTKTEVELWRAAGGCKNLVALEEVFWDDRFCYIVMEKCQRTLFSALAMAPSLNEFTLGRIFPQMLAGLAHLHNCRIVHRDVKPDNFLVGGRDGQIVKLGDFGLSAPLPPRGETMQSNFAIGTPPYMAPEMVTGQEYDETLDMWSLGVTVYVLFYGMFPYMPKEHTSLAMKKAIASGSYGPRYETSRYERRSPSATAFVQSLLSRRRYLRPTAEEAMRMPFLQQAAVNIATDAAPLKPLLHLARRLGAFDTQCNSEDPADFLLAHLQRRHAKQRQRVTTISTSKLLLSKSSSKSVDHIPTPSTARSSSSVDGWKSLGARTVGAGKPQDSDEEDRTTHTSSVPTSTAPTSTDEGSSRSVSSCASCCLPEEGVPLDDLLASDGNASVTATLPDTGRTLGMSCSVPYQAGAEVGVPLDDLIASDYQSPLATAPAPPAACGIRSL